MQTREYSERVLAHSIDDADAPVGFATLLWRRPRPVDVRDRIREISRQFTGAGWKNLPQELVDEILGHLLDDPPTLKACSLTCKCLFGATRPLIHRRLVCSGSRPERPKPKIPLFSRRKRDSGAFGWLIDVDRSGILLYTQHLTVNFRHPLSPKDAQEHLPLLQSITRLHTLTLDIYHLHLFIPVFNEHFGMFTNTLRHLDIQGACGMERQLLYIICQFPLLEDLTIIYLACEGATHSENLVPTITQSPPLRGKLVAQVHSRVLFESLAALPGGLNFRSLELRWCEVPAAIFARCGHTVTSISCLRSRHAPSESDTSIHACVVM